MTRNPYLRRVLGEDAAAAQDELAAPPETMPSPEAPLSPEPATPPEAVITPQKVQQLAKLWQSGDKMGVASSLMFTEASYKDFVNLVYIIGQQAGLELGAMLDELADESGQEPPHTPPQYSSILRRAAGEEEAGVV